jgi:hypothetical protein
MRKSDAVPEPSVSLERFRLVIDQASGQRFVLYTSWLEGDRWVLGRIRAAHPGEFDLDLWQPIPELHPDRLGVHSIKDPVVLHRNGRWYMWAHVFPLQDGRALTVLFESVGGAWHLRAAPALPAGELGAWDYQTARVDTVWPTAAGFAYLYSGAPERGGRHGDTRERTGVAAAAGHVLTAVRVSTAPVHWSQHGDESLRYVDLTALGDGQVLVLFEQAVPGPEDHLLERGDYGRGRHALMAKVLQQESVDACAAQWLRVAQPVPAG